MKKIPDTLLLFFILIAAARWVPTSAEDYYMTLAKAWLDPNWIRGSWTLAEPAGIRALYNLIVGGVLRVADFHTASLGLKLLLAWWYARSLSEIVHPAVLAVVCLVPTFFGGETIFLGCEPKHLAYGVVFWHLANPRRTFTALTLASWLHLHVGAWYALYWFVTNPRQWKLAVNYVLMLLPLLLYLNALQDTGGLHLSCDPDKIAAPLLSGQNCYPLLCSIRELSGFFLCIIAIWCSSGGISHNIMAGSCLIALATSFYPANYVVRYGPYSLLALAFLLELQQHFERWEWLRKLVRMVGVISMLFLVGTNIKDCWQYAHDTRYQAAIEYARQLPAGTRILCERSDFIRRSARDVFVSNRFMPNVPKRLCEWRERWALATDTNDVRNNSILGIRYVRIDN